MGLYYYIFACAYWVSIKDLKEKSSPQEYAFLFVSIVDLLLFVMVSGSINLFAGRNLFSGAIVILSSSVIAMINYIVFLRGKRYVVLIEKFERVSKPESRNKRVRALAITFVVVGLGAILVSVLNGEMFQKSF
jgi:hypothetical protein